MKRQKRDRLERAHSRGYQAGLVGKSRENCPYSALEAKEQWLGGWREARSEVGHGLFT
ncbi:MAG: ribosome modulation factor [Kangiellaceae bacterium]|nr:ribosome modulation factor [Kangiellaceae bacterium]